MLQMYLFPVALLAGLGFLLGVILLIASRRFAVKENPLVEELSGILPGTNCGACGFAGCRGLAEGFATDNELEASCPVGGEDVATQIAEAMGVERKIAERKVARILCGARTDTAARLPSYQGIQDCSAGNAIPLTTHTCGYGCLVMGNCVRACPFDAIAIVDGIVRVKEEKCTGCGVCVKACPRNCIELMGADRRIWVACHSQDKGALVRKNCKVGCIGCMKCVKKCPTGAVKVKNFYATISQEICSMCGECARQCPTDAINVKPAKAGEGVAVGPAATESVDNPPTAEA